MTEWWQKGIFYEIYPRSYQDTNGDGVGDLRGIKNRLGYIQSINVDAVWLSPIYPSPMADFGYDVADYTDIHPMFGTLEEFDELLEEIHQRGLKLILDLVPNHSSDEHPWFKESRTSKDNPRREWYIWRDPAPDGGPPNNWLSYFGGPAWTFDEKTGQYYLHLFHKKQPDLNYQNPAVMDAMKNNIRFWLDRGVDGFRIDVIFLMWKDREFRDEPPNPHWNGVDPVHQTLKTYTSNLPEVHDLIAEMRSVFDEYTGRVMIGEIYLPLEELVKYYGPTMNECHLPFNFSLILTEWQAGAVKELVDRYEALLPGEGWPNYVLGNHDQHRLATRIGGRDKARVAMLLLLTLRGTPTIYYGEEIGMEDGVILPEQRKDPVALNIPEKADLIGRDPERTPMQWSSKPHAGFCEPEVEPWLPVAPNYETVNVEVEEKGEQTFLTLFRTLTALRRSEPALTIGDYHPLDVHDQTPDVFAFMRKEGEGESFVVLTNFSSEEQTLDLSSVATSGEVVVSSYLDREGSSLDFQKIILRKDEGLLVRI